MGKIVVVGSLNMDLVIQTDLMPRMGETVTGKGFMQVPGGKGANQAVAAARLGENVSMIGRVGNDIFGLKLLENLGKNCVNTDMIKAVDHVSTGVAFILVNNGDNCIILNPGANYTFTPEDVNTFETVISKADILVTQMEIPLETVKNTLKIAKKHKVSTILNPAPAQELDDEILSNVDIILPNETEVELLTGIPIKSDENIVKALRFFEEKGIRNCVITLGADGIIYNGRDGITHLPAYPITAVDSTAAGDSFVGALAVKLSQNVDFDYAVQFCNAVGALTATKFGAQISLPTLSEVNAFMQKTKPPQKKSIISSPLAIF